MSEGVSTFSAVCVTVNMMIGAGFLAFPSGFYNGGILASAVVTSVVCYWMVISCTWEGRSAIHSSRVLATGRKIPEVTEAFFVFGGKFWRDIYAIVLGVSLMSCSWVLAILFANTLSSSIPLIYHPEEMCSSSEESDICRTRFLINVVILAFITTPLALMDIGEQWWIQNTLTFIRVIRILMMCVTPMLATTQADMLTSFPVTFNPKTVEYPNMIFGSWNGLAHTLSAAVFSQYLNGSVPIIVDSLKDRNNYMTTLHYTFGICLFLYIWLSTVVTMRFGSDTLNPCNINWTGYRWPFCSGESGSVCDLSARAVEFIVVFCPAVDVASAFPFIGIILGNSLTEILLGTPPVEQISSTDGISSGSGEALDEHAPIEHAKMTATQYKFYNKLFRFIMNSIPMVLAVSISNFSLVIQVTGGISVLICLVFPAYLSMRCNSYMDKAHAHSLEDGHSLHNYFSTITDGPLSWVDGLFSTTGSSSLAQEGKTSVPFYGSVPVQESSSEGKNIVPSGVQQEFIEQLWFKKVFMWMGVVITVLILYISLAS